MLNITQNDYNVIKQRYTERYIKLNLLDFQYRIVDEISGNMVSCNVSCDTNSDLRRSCSVSLVVTDNSFDIKAGGKIFLDRYIQVYIGLKNIRTDEIQWYNQGIYLIDAPTWQYDAMNNTLSFSGLDLMSKLTGARNGQLEGLPTVIAQGESVREAMIATLQLGGFSKYIISECTNRDGSIQAVPYDIEISQGGYVYDILSALRDILPQYQIYFDVDGVFHYELILNGEDEPVLIDDDIWNAVEISENISTDFTSVKNYVEVYGRTHDIEYYPSAISIGDDSLPEGYTEVTYLKSYGAQYINTEYAPTSNAMKIIIDFEYTASHTDSSLFGSQGVSRTFSIVPYGTPSFYVGRIEGALSYNAQLNTRYVLEVETDKSGGLSTTWNGVKITGQYSDALEMGYPIYIFANNMAGQYAAQFTSMKLYSFKMYDNGVLVRNFIPCIGTGNVNGLYDTVTKKLYQNAGSDSFSTGTIVEHNDATINMTIAELTTLSEYTTIGFTTPDAVEGNIQLAVNSFSAKYLVDSDGSHITSLENNVYYVARYQSDGTWLFLGHLQAQAIWKDENPESPFYVNSSVGVIREVLCGGDYDNIMSDELALERAKIEIYWKCRLNDSITLNIIPIPWMDVNIVVSHAPKDSDEQNRYIIKSYSCDYSSVSSIMSVNMITFYPYYPMY